MAQAILDNDATMNIIRLALQRYKAEKCLLVEHGWPFAQLWRCMPDDYQM